MCGPHCTQAKAHCNCSRSNCTRHWQWPAAIPSADGALQHTTVGRLFDWHISYTNAGTKLEGKLSLDSSDWRWGDGLLHALLGTRQTLFAADLRSGRLRMTARLDGRVTRPRVRNPSGRRRPRRNRRPRGVRRSGLRTPAPPGPSRLRLHDDIDCSARSVNAGVTLDDPCI